jgi:hypothetical protein
VTTLSQKSAISELESQMAAENGGSGAAGGGAGGGQLSRKNSTPIFKILISEVTRNTSEGDHIRICISILRCISNMQESF